jgi:cytochrome P450
VVSSLVNLLLGRFIVRARQAHFKHSADRVDRRLASRTTRPDIWTQVLRQEGERALSLDEMHSNADMFMIAGTETTATLVSGLIYYLLMNPDKIRTLQDEIRGAFEAREDMTIGRLAQLKYLNACIEEGLRVYPPVPIGLPRLTPPGGTAICGEWIPANVSTHVAEMRALFHLIFSKTTVYVTAFAAFHSPVNFRAPDEFIPERWISSEYDSDNKSALQPFSIGPRNCLGKKYILVHSARCSTCLQFHSLAYHETRLILAMVLHRFNMSICAESRAWNDQKVYGLWQKPPLMVRITVPDGQRT